MTTEFKRMLHRQYGKSKVKHDIFDRKKATPAEIHRTMHPSNVFEDMVRFYPPTALDIIDKND